MEWLDFARNVFIVIGGIKTVSTVTPNKHPNKIVNFIFQLVNVLALNIGKDKNAN